MKFPVTILLHYKVQPVLYHSQLIVTGGVGLRRISVHVSVVYYEYRHILYGIPHLIIHVALYGGVLHGFDVIHREHLMVHHHQLLGHDRLEIGKSDPQQGAVDAVYLILSCGLVRKGHVLPGLLVGEIHTGTRERFSVCASYETLYSHQFRTKRGECEVHVCVLSLGRHDGPVLAPVFVVEYDYLRLARSHPYLVFSGSVGLGVIFVSETVNYHYVGVLQRRACRIVNVTSDVAYFGRIPGPGPCIL